MVSKILFCNSEQWCTVLHVPFQYIPTRLHRFSFIFPSRSDFLSTPARLGSIFFHSQGCVPFLSPCPFFWCHKRRTYTRGEPPISVIWMGNGLTLEVGPPVNDGPGRDPADEMMRAIPPSPAGPCNAFSLRSRLGDVFDATTKCR